jgi:hypothetical protein
LGAGAGAVEEEDDAEEGMFDMDEDVSPCAAAFFLPLFLAIFVPPLLLT